MDRSDSPAPATSSRRSSRTPEPGLSSYTSTRNSRGKRRPPADTTSVVVRLLPLALLAIAGLIMWPPSFSLIRMGVAGLVVSAAAPSWGYKTIGEAIADWKNQPQATYPTQFTRGIIPRAYDSHNDYWRDVPLFSAISFGAISVEADVWMWDDDLFVGHDPSSLSKRRTFSSLYVQPLMDILKQQNPSTSFPYTNNTRNGVFDTTVGQTLYLFVDVKTDGNSTWPLVIKQLAPLRDGGWLSYWDNEAGSLKPGAVTVIGTGNTPFSQVQAYSTAHRDVFYDAPITAFTSGSPGEYNTSNVVIASGSLASALGAPMSGNTFSDSQLLSLGNQVKGAHAAGIKVRYWETPGWPISKRDYVWKTLESLGVDLLNADDLEAAAGLKELW
ncbi:altered inheritance of mitochondria protein 6 [Ceratobasidium sp. AG-Ba]|nr:altered inheritance of mitochondria protein 6 [Ceratobasidium sp. AG-Ba]